MSNLFEYAARTQRVFNPLPLLLPVVVSPHAPSPREAVAPANPSSLPGLPAVGKASPYAARNANLGQTNIANGVESYLQVLRSPATPRTDDPYLEVAGQPSLRIFLENGTNDTVIELRRRSNYTDHMTDFSGLMHGQESALEMLRAMSQGPYTERDLIRLNRPYATKNLASRKLPSQFGGKRLNAVKGIRGAVPNLTIVNKQSGHFAESWESGFRIENGEVILTWRNTAKTERGFPYAFALAAGTTKMRAHGPFTYAVIRHMAQMDTAWRRESARAWHQSQTMPMRTTARRRVGSSPDHLGGAHQPRNAGLVF